VRRDVLVVTLPLLPADWYADEIRRRTGGRWSDRDPVPGALRLSDQRAALGARWAVERGRPIAASPAVSVAERAWLGGDWILRGPLYVATAPVDGIARPARIDTGAAARWMARLPAERDGAPSVDGVAAVMTGLLACPRLALPTGVDAMRRDSLELKCNLR
jgi:hypothetical protein